MCSIAATTRQTRLSLSTRVRRERLCRSRGERRAASNLAQHVRDRPLHLLALSLPAHEERLGNQQIRRLARDDRAGGLRPQIPGVTGEAADARPVIWRLIWDQQVVQTKSR